MYFWNFRWVPAVSGPGEVFRNTRLDIRAIIIRGFGRSGAPHGSDGSFSAVLASRHRASAGFLYPSPKTVFFVFRGKTL